MNPIFFRFGTMPVLPWAKQFPKSNEKAKQCRLEGNKNYRIANYDFALEAYNAGLCYAPPGSEEIPLIYGNRSAVYCEMGEYALAMDNIKLARENGFPAEKMAQLDARGEKCKSFLEAQAGDKQIVSSFFKLSHPPNPKVPFIVNCLELRKCKKFGRGIYTTKDLKTGDIIAIEDPAFTITSAPEKIPYCAFCTKKNKGSLLPCNHCTSVMYCSEECRQKTHTFAYEVFNDPGTRSDLGESLKMQSDAFRAAGGMKKLLELLKGNENKTIFDFDFSNPEDPGYQKNMLIALNGLCKNGKAAIGAQVLSITPKNEKPRTKAERNALLKFASNQFKLVSTNLSRFKEGFDGIFVFKSLMNHSCLPDVQSFKFNEKLISVVTRPVKAGSQLFVCYGLTAFTASKKQDRAEKLKNHGFKCDCDACVNDYPLVLSRKDSRFVEPDFKRMMQQQLTPAEAIQQFKENCKYIDENFHKMPCFEVQILSLQNVAIILSIDPSCQNLKQNFGL